MSTPHAEAFTFGDPEPVMDRYDMLYTGCWLAEQEYYEPPVDLSALAKSYRATAHHGSALQVKRNILVKSFEPTDYLSRQNFSRMALDYLVFGNMYGEKIENRLGRLIEIRPALAKYCRRGVKPGQYWWVHDLFDKKEFPADSIVHIMEPDIDQELYGVPDYLGSLQSAWLNESATLFRRKYYQNGSHAGFILYMTDAAQQQEDIDTMRQALKDSKGPGNFKNLFMYSPNGKKDGLQLIPISEVAAKDEFWNIKNATRDDQLAGHRVPPQLMGIIPSNTGGFGDSEKAARVFAANELEPLQERMLELNDIVGKEVISFRPYSLGETSQNTP
ncbi:phage portal protein [Marinobacter oulmenensis]|uniref:PBSX family phage portal protein n=1 Tax=Marinobacter oulmenensis TaxID=643747 RepID=A0A840U8C9_9GAMM|nr:phage portal protein [Marinobacter oulmenensis]MBB5320483.1 PBSX family phage portal protein [Marinobacter oulmenensis]